MKFRTTDNKSKKEPTVLYRSANGRFTVTFRWWSGRGLVLLGLVIGMIVFTKSHARLCSHARLDNFLTHVQQRGGSLVRCKEGECEDVRTGAYFGRKPDGFYLVYPDGTMNAEELREQRDFLQQLMRDEERECGVN